MKKTIFLLLFIFLFVSHAFASPFSFAVFGDNRNGDAAFMKIIERMNGDKSIEFAVNTGDLVPAGLPGEYDNYLKMVSKSKVKIHNVVGNHDIANGGGGLFRKHFGPFYTSWDYKGAHFVILDNVGQPGLGRSQIKWLKKDLSENKLKPVFVFMHKPLFDTSGKFPHYIMKDGPDRDALIKILREFGVEHVFSGHIHGYSKGASRGITQIITGGAGARLYLQNSDGGFYHYVKVTVDGSRVTDEVVKIYENE